MSRKAADIRRSIESNWKEYLTRYANLFSSNHLSGSTPPSVFVGTYGYPKVLVGPMLPPVHGDTAILDSPELWHGKNFEEIVNYRLSLVRGIKPVKIDDMGQRYVQDLQDMVMSESPSDAEIDLVKNASPVVSIDGESTISGPIGEIKSVKFSNSTLNKKITKAYYDTDLAANDAVLELYNMGIEISKIQKCLSIGLFGKNRKLVPTRWSITATDDMISKSLIAEILNYNVIDYSIVFSYNHLGNYYSVLLFPSRWMFEMQEGWYDMQGNIGFGSAFEDVNGMKDYPETAGAHFASRLAVTEYLHEKQLQAGVMVLREIRPEYAVPVGVWQVREGVRMAMKQEPVVVENFAEGLRKACIGLSIAENEWRLHSKLHSALKQKSISEFF